MKITREDVLKVAHLARLEMDETAVDAVAVQIGKILDYIDQLNRVNTEGIALTSHAISLTNAFREDEGHPHLDRHAVLANAPESDEGCFIVPRVIG
ncbi:MAG: Asp-tRNA(Asn)/Glu-tRNA(Gln) amidotransferase subunit GatC [Desulfobacterales bacterium]|jgi:aspartyl-tRNA(Asn)/glutamyl-tRNA(Gln) amidotransferase subunit C|nr:Asp-tRNA(Asn)/Glu-tRNA(Gln) amidotransferase subunit GatC [Desulfobacterales bacterium]